MGSDKIGPGEGAMSVRRGGEAAAEDDVEGHGSRQLRASDEDDTEGHGSRQLR